MQVHRRRALLAMAGTLAAAGTVAAATALRKPDRPEVATLVPTAAPDLAPIGTLMPIDPPRAPAEARFLDAEGTPHQLADFRGKGLIVNLWATWCVPCVAEMPALQAAAGKLADDGILVLPLSSDRGGAAVVRAFYEAHKLTALPIWLDPKGEAARAWGARGLPTSLIIDRQGLERGRLEGGIAWASEDALATVRRLVGVAS